MTWEVIYPAFSLARKAVSSAISSGFPNLFMARPLIIASFSSADRNSVGSVMISPGAIAFTVILREPASRARLFVKAIIPPLEAE
jgi:hypothetical protein